MKEIWKAIKGYEGIYEVSNMGRITSFHQGLIKILKIPAEKNGYVRVRLCDTPRRAMKRMLVHRIVALTFLSGVKNKNFINHIDSNRSNNCANNLEWCTQAENQQHCIKMGRFPNKQGEHCGHNKLPRMMLFK